MNETDLSSNDNMTQIFGKLISSMKETLKAKYKEDGELIQKAHQSPVDIELALNQLRLEKNGWFFAKKSKKDDISIKIATRIVPEDFD